MVGSLAKGSLNRKLSIALTRLAPEDLHLREIPIGELPLYSYDYDADYMKEFHAFIERVYMALPRAAG